MAEAEEMFQKGNKLYEQGYMLQANYYYGQAVVAVASLRYGLSELIYVKQRDERPPPRKPPKRNSARRTRKIWKIGDGKMREDSLLRLPT